MDRDRFDEIVRLFAAKRSRRSAIAALLSAALLGQAPDVFAKAGKKKRRDNDRGKGNAPRRGRANERANGVDQAPAGDEAAAEAPSSDESGTGDVVSAEHRPGGRRRQGSGRGQGRDKGKHRGKGKNRKQRGGEASDAVAKAGGACREAGHPCEGNQECCANLICAVSGPGNASRCTPCGDSGERCCANGACAAGHVCTADDQCVACGADGQPCCTEGAACTADDPCLVAACQNGTCRTTAKDCSGENDDCNDGVCRQSDGQCVKRPKDEGTSCGANRECVGGVCEVACGVAGKRCCTEGAACTSDDPCLVAACQNGTCTTSPKDCSGEGDACNDGVCRQSDGACVKRPKADGLGCNADNDSCTVGDSCQNGVCTPGAGVSCGHLDEPCNRGVCQPDGSCTREPRNNDELCLAGANVCTDVGACRNGSCVPGPAVVCTASDECHVAGICDPETGRCSNPTAQNGTACGRNGECRGGECVEPCLPVQAVCDPATDTCCDQEGEACFENAACSDAGEGRCCRPEGAFCEQSCDCCGGVCAGGVCCVPNQQCTSSNECCEGQACIDDVCASVCGTDRALCGGGMGTAPCCDGYRCFDGECWPGTCLAPTEECSSASECCPDGIITCERSRPNGENICCHPYNATCRVTDECCGIRVCEGEGKCCIGGPFDPDRPLPFGTQLGTCRGREHECCPGRRCHPTEKWCCVDEGQPVPNNEGGFLDCCHFAERDGVCTCHRKGEACSAPTGNPFLSNCCDGLFCFNGVCNTFGCNGFGCNPSAPCCIGCTFDENTGCCDCP